MTVKLLGRLPDGDGLQHVEGRARANERQRFLAVVELRVAAVTHHVNGDDEWTVVLAVEAVEAVVDDAPRASLLMTLRNLADERAGTPSLPYKD